MKLESQVETLSLREIHSIVDSARDILENVGLKVCNHEVVSRLRERGCLVKGSLVRFPGAVIEETLDETRRFTYSNQRRVSEGELRFYATGQALLTCDVESNRIRPTTVNDQAEISRLIDGIPGLQRAHPTFIPQDVPVMTRDIHTLATIALNSRDPGAITPIFSAQAVNYMIEIGTVIRGSLEELKKRPCFEFSCYFTSPFQICRENLDIALELNKHGLPFDFCTMPIAGATSPVTLAGTLVTETAECIGATIIMSVLNGERGLEPRAVPLILDFKIGAPSESSPESILLNLATLQIMTYLFGIKERRLGAQVSSKLPDFQSALERVGQIMCGIMAGCRSFGSLGTLANADVGSMVQLVLDVESINASRRLIKGIDVNENSLAVDLVKRVGIGGNYLDKDHTRRYFREEMWFPELMDRRFAGAWVREPKTMVDYAREKVHNLLDKAENLSPLDAYQTREIERIVKKADEELGSR